MKILTYFSILLFFFLAACNQDENQSKIVIETAGFADSTKIYLMDLETEISDSGYIISNNLVFSVEVDEPTRFVIRPVYTGRESIDYRYFWKENKQLHILAENGKLMSAVVEGSEIQKQVDVLDASKQQLKTRLDSIKTEYKSLPKEDKEERTAMRNKGKEIEQAITDVDINYVKNKPDELYSAYALKTLMLYTIPQEQTKELYDNLSIDAQSSKYGVKVKRFLDLSQNLEIGDKAVDFQLPDLDGNLVGLSNFKDKYILLDFWASNCGPCRMENPNLLKNYRAYRDRGFEIISISLDKRREDWANAVKKDSMIWTTVSELKGFDGDVQLTYNVYFMPTYFLIDPNGVIIDKIMVRGKVDKKINELFSNIDTDMDKRISQAE